MAKAIPTPHSTTFCQPCKPTVCLFGLAKRQLPPDMRLLSAAAGKLSLQSRRLAVKLVNALKEHEGKEG
jgi:hypothetical protein